MLHDSDSDGIDIIPEDGDLPQSPANDSTLEVIPENLIPDEVETASTGTLRIVESSPSIAEETPPSQSGYESDSTIDLCKKRIIKRHPGLSLSTYVSRYLFNNIMDRNANCEFFSVLLQCCLFTQMKLVLL